MRSNRSSKREGIYALIVLLAFCWPLVCFGGSSGGSSGGKTIDLVASDFLLLILGPIIVLKSRRGKIKTRSLAGIPTLVSLLMAYCAVLALIGMAQPEGSLLNVLSCGKFAKPFVFLFIGMGLGTNRRFVNEVGKVLPWIGASLTLVLIGGAIVDPRFPNLRWGNNFFGYEPYGYPNSFMTFVSFLLPFQLLALVSYGKRNLKLFFGATSTATIVLIFLSLSRSSNVAMLISSGAAIFLAMKHFETPKSVGGVLFAGLVVVGVLGVIYADTAGSKLETAISEHLPTLDRRIERTVEDDSLSGRKYIWMKTFELIQQRPFFGHMFFPLSDTIDQSTAHNQYLEILYKIGLVGGILFVTLFILIVKQLVPSNPNWRSSKTIGGPLLCAFLGVLVGNISQPNLNYSITANFLYFLVGLIVAFHRQLPKGKRANY